jgi:hypothetical protein
MASFRSDEEDSLSYPLTSKFTGRECSRPTTNCKPSSMNLLRNLIASLQDDPSSDGKRQSNRHLPANMQHRHGRYYFVRCGKWHAAGEGLRPGADGVRRAGRIAAERADGQGCDLAIHRTRGPSQDRPAVGTTLEGYRYSATNLCAVFGKMALADLTPADGLPLRRGYGGNVQANRDKALLSAAFTHARNMGAFHGR